MSKLDDLNRIAVALEKLVILQSSALTYELQQSLKPIEIENIFKPVRRTIKEHNKIIENINSRDQYE